jgi:phage terminase large subunit
METATQIDFVVIKKIWRFLKNSPYKINLIYGGAGAGKSCTVAQYIIYLLLRAKNKHILVTRKTNPSLRLTAYRLVLNLLEHYQIPYEHHKADQIIKFKPNRNLIFFRGLDDPEKIKSAEFNYVWMEEATEFTLEEYQQVKLRLRRNTTDHRRNQMFLTFNPIPSWIKEYFFDERKEDDIGIMRVTYKDNPFLDEEYIRLLEELAEQDRTYHKIYALGEFATPGHVIYTHYTIEDKAPNHFDEIIYGVDFGYNNPTAVLKIGILDNEFWVLDEIYQTHLTNQDLIDLLKDFIHSPTALIYCDSAEPQRIQELKRAGFNARPAFKDVKLGIDIVKRQKLHIVKTCANTLKEIKLYRWKQDAQGNILDHPVKFNDHAMDALRYAIASWIKAIGTVSIKIL